MNVTLEDALSVARGTRKAIEEGYEIPMIGHVAVCLMDELLAAKAKLKEAQEQEPVAWLCGQDNTQNKKYAEWFMAFTKEPTTPLYAAPKPHPSHTHCDNCGLTWLDDGLNPLHCPYCVKPPAPAVPDWNVNIERIRDVMHMLGISIDESVEGFSAALSANIDRMTLAMKRHLQKIADTPAAPAVPTDEQIHAAYREALGQSIRERDMPEIRKFARALLGAKP